jgi:hypothetical protein
VPGLSAGATQVVKISIPNSKIRSQKELRFISNPLSESYLMSFWVQEDAHDIAEYATSQLLSADCSCWQFASFGMKATFLLPQQFIDRVCEGSHARSEDSFQAGNTAAHTCKARI